MIKSDELEKIVSKYKKLEDQLNVSIKDRDEFILVSKEYSELKPIVEQINIFNELNKEISDLNQIIENEELEHIHTKCGVDLITKLWCGYIGDFIRIYPHQWIWCGYITPPSFQNIKICL